MDRDGTAGEAPPAERHAQNEPQSIEDHLLSPGSFKGFRCLRAGGKITSSGTETVRLQWSPETIQKIISWLETGNVEQLAGLLQEHPRAIAHPLVFHQIFHLRWLRYLPDWGDLEEGYSSSSEYVPPAGTREAASKALQALAAAWVRGLLPGWTADLKPPKRRGAPRKMKDWEPAALLFEFDELLDKLNEKLSRHPILFRRKTNESLDRFIERVAELVQQLHMESWRSYKSETYEIPGEAEFDDAGNLNLQAIDIRSWRKRLPFEETKEIARQAVRAKRLLKRLLVYGLLAHYERKTLHQIRGIIERA